MIYIKGVERQTICVYNFYKNIFGIQTLILNVFYSYPFHFLCDDVPLERLGSSKFSFQLHILSGSKSSLHNIKNLLDELNLQIIYA